MRDELSKTEEPNKSWVVQLPLQFACFLLGGCLVSSQINPCDATSVAMGSSIVFVLMALGIGFLVAVDSILVPQAFARDRLLQLFIVSSIVFGIWVWVCTLQVPGQGNARFAYNGCWQWIAQGVLMLSISRLYLRTRMAAAVCSMMLACAAGTVAYAGYQYFVGMPAFRETFANDPNSVLEKLDIVPGSAAAMQFANRLLSLEPTGPFALTNSLAGLMAAWLVFVVLISVSQHASANNGSTAKSAKWKTQLLVIGLMAGFSVTLLFTKSRSAWLATVIGLMAACFVQPVIRSSGLGIAKRFRVALAVAVALVVFALGAVLIRDPFILSESGKSLSYRFDYWRGAFSLMQSKPWTGYGVANFQHSYDRVKVITASESPADPHNFLLETAAAGGYPLLLSLVFILAILFLKLVESSRKPQVEVDCPFGAKREFMETGRLAFSVGGGACFVGILLFGLLFGDWDSLNSCMLFAVVSTAVFFGIERSQWLREDQQSDSIWLISAAVVVLHLMASGGWMQPGLMNSVCVLVGLAFGACLSRQHTDASPGTRRGGAVASWLGLVLVVASIVGFLKTTWFPVLGASALMHSASSDAVETVTTEDLLGGMAIDPYDPELARMAANRCVRELRRNDLSSVSRQRYSKFLDESLEEYVRRDPNQWMPYAQCGQWLAVLVDSEPNEGLNIAIQTSKKVRIYGLFSRAAELYPNSIQTQLQAGVAAAWCGKYSEARAHCDKVEEIDRKTPHLDRKLASVFVFFPKQLDPSWDLLDKNSKADGQEGNARGEPVLRWLRTNLP